MRRIHLLHYIILLTVLSLGVLSFVSAEGDKTMQLVVIGITAATYVIWGILHHLIMKDLHMKVVVEYLLIGLIAFILVLTII